MGQADREKAIAILAEMVMLTPEPLDGLDDVSMHEFLGGWRPIGGAKVARA